MLGQALESLLGRGGNSIGRLLKERTHLILGTPKTHRNWLNDFYSLRSQIAHGGYPLVRESIATDEEIGDYLGKFWTPLDRVRAVLLGLIQNLIINKSISFSFDQIFEYRRIKY